MPAGAGIFNKLFRKNKKPLNTQRVVLSNTQKYGFADADGSKNAPDLEPVDFTNLHEERFLEDTPAEEVIFDKPKEKRRSDKSAKTEGFRGVKDIDKSSLTGINTEKRFKKNKKSVFSIFSAIPGIFKKKSKKSNTSALEFAANKRRLGRKGRKNRRILVYAGTGFIAAIATLVIVFVPGLAAPVDTQSPGVLSPSATGSSYIAITSDAVTGTDVSESPTVSPTVSPELSPTPESTPVETTPPQVEVPIIDIDEEVKTFMVEADDYYNEMGYSNNHYKYTQEEKYMLSQVIYREARGEGLKGMIAVGNVVMNRVLSNRFPGNTIKYVLSASNQFAYYPDGKTNAWSNRAANLVLDRERWVVPQNIYFFKVPSSANPTADWYTHKYVMTIGHHAFYSDKKYGRTGKTPPELFERTFQWPTMGCKPEMRVYRLQYMLNKLGYNVKADKYFGEDTKDAIIDFQKKHKLKADGIAGARTLKTLIKEFGEENYYNVFIKNKK